MKKFIRVAIIFSTLGVMNAANASETPANVNWANPYIGAAITGQRSYVRSGGFNTVAPTFTNTGVDMNEGLGIALMAGFNKLHQFAPHTWLRSELEFDVRDQQQFTTNSCAGFGGCGGHFTYKAHVKSYGGFLNAYIDHDLPDTFIGSSKNHPVSIFLGGGLGAFQNRADTQDSVVFGGDDRLGFAYQIGGGGKVPLCPGTDLVVGLRYMNLGQSHIDLHRVAGGGPAGDLKLDNNAVEGRIGVNIALDSLMHR